MRAAGRGVREAGGGRAVGSPSWPEASSAAGVRAGRGAGSPAGAGRPTGVRRAARAAPSPTAAAGQPAPAGLAGSGHVGFVPGDAGGLGVALWGGGRGKHPRCRTAWGGALRWGSTRGARARLPGWGGALRGGSTRGARRPGVGGGNLRCWVGGRPRAPGWWWGRALSPPRPAHIVIQFRKLAASEELRNDFLSGNW